METRPELSRNSVRLELAREPTTSGHCHVGPAVNWWSCRATTLEPRPRRPRRRWTMSIGRAADLTWLNLTLSKGRGGVEARESGRTGGAMASRDSGRVGDSMPAARLSTGERSRGKGTRSAWERSRRRKAWEACLRRRPSGRPNFLPHATRACI